MTGVVRFYHQTTPARARAILAGGFLDEPTLPEDMAVDGNRHWGAWLADRQLPADVAAGWAAHEWLEDGRRYREWLVPAAEVNRAATLAVVECDALDERRALVPDVVLEPLDDAVLESPPAHA